MLWTKRQNFSKHSVGSALGGGGGGMQYDPKDSKQHIEHDSMTLAKGATTGGSWAFQRRKHLG